MTTTIIMYDENSIGETGHVLYLRKESDGSLVNAGGTAMASEANGRFVYGVDFGVAGVPTEVCRALTIADSVASANGWLAVNGTTVVDDYPTDLSALETKAQADARQAVLVADIAIGNDRLGYTLAALAGNCADAGTAAETYAITIGADTFTIDHTGLDATGNRSTATLTKS